MTDSDLAMVIPVWFGETVPEETIRGRLLRTLHGVEQYVSPGKVVLVADGDDRSAEILRSLLPEFERRNGGPFRLIVSEANGGKGAAVASGLIGKKQFPENPAPYTWGFCKFLEMGARQRPASGKNVPGTGRTVQKDSQIRKEFLLDKRRC